MTIPIIKDGKIKLEEGLILEFMVQNKVKLQDDLDYYVLEDPNGTRHFIEAGLYSRYNIKTGEQIHCRIDKINCTGRVFLEPLHPYYKEGRLYDFLLLSHQRKDGKNHLVIEDIYHNKIEMLVSGGISMSLITKKTVKGEVKLIKKGIPEIDLII
jgi:hypothetical protein